MRAFILCPFVPCLKKFFRRYKVSSSGYTKSTDKEKENKIPFSSVGTQKLDAKEKL
jgi:hypothetical protein